jgi:hypothetical protein
MSTARVRRLLPSDLVRAGAPRLLRAAALAWAVLCASPAWGLAENPLLRDFRLTLLAREALQSDPVLAPWNLAVHVQNGVAVLVCEAPSKELAQRAVARLRQLPELTGVRNQLSADPLAGFPGREVVARPPPRPPNEEDLSSLPSVGPVRVVPRPGPSPAVGASPQPKGAATFAVSPPVKGATPGQASPTSTATPAPVFPAKTSSGIERAIRGLQLKEERFRRLRVEVQGDRVILSGAVPAWRDLHELSAAITRIPGVAGVTVREIRTEPPPR